MIQEFVDIWDDHRGDVEAKIRAKEPDEYKDLVRMVIEMLHDHSDGYKFDKPDPERIHEIDDGDYQGTLVYVIADSGYQPDTYWYVKVGYGSCSGCDTLEHISSLGWNYEDKSEVADEKIKQYMMLALHIIQGLKQMGGDTV